MEFVICKPDERVPLLNSSSMSRESLSYILKILPENKSILMIGSGESSLFLSKFYDILSIEHDEEYIDRYDIEYLHVPLTSTLQNTYWYDQDTMKKCLEKKYDMIVVDGPPGRVSYRSDFMSIIDYIKDLENTILVVDDAQRMDERLLVDNIKQRTKRDCVTIESFTKSENNVGTHHFPAPKYKLTAFFEVSKTS